MKLRNRNVLLIDDDFSEIINLQKYLVELNLNLSLLVANSFSESFEILCGNNLKQKPEILLLNLDNTRMDGRQFLRLVASFYSLRHIKIFLLSDTELDEEEFEELNVTAVLRKPLNFNHLSDPHDLRSYNLLINAFM